MPISQAYYIQSLRGIAHPKKRKLAEHVANSCGVTVEHFLDIVAKRKAAKVFRFYRRRERLRTIAKSGYLTKLGPKVKEGQAYHGEGEFDVLLRMAGLSTRGFAAAANVSPSGVRNWFGHPLYNWPIEFLKTWIWAKRMAEVLDLRGIDPEQYRVKEIRMDPVHTGTPSNAELEAMMVSLKASKAAKK